MQKNKNLWDEIEADLKEKTKSGYKMALLDSDKLLRLILKDKGYPGKDLKKQLFWAGINLDGRQNLKNALKKKEEILNVQDYRLSSFEIEDALEAYRKTIEWVLSAEKISLKRKIGIVLENHLFLKNTSLTKIFILILLIFFGIKFLSSTEMGRSIVSKVVEADNFLFSWLKIFLLFGLIIAVTIFATFIYLDKRKKIKIKE
ncbi:hypothetical protein C4544_07035 [candidate division WS5 bacterium]|uniref:Uncharacterized protein n=1 Tax=candidate division WS5 bacterium TaxID=2093353 RepID=A0A419DAB8_9BACT|nr:MAG: hypothetical protein C4544_07035 [candidate division WS5 bacterium]